MTDTDPHVFSDLTDLHTKETLGRLRAMAAAYADGPQGVAAADLADTFKAMANAEVLAAALAAVLIDQDRTDRTRAALGPALETADLTGVEIRVIGPEANARAVLTAMAGAGIPAVGERGPMDAVERPDTVRFYTYTDEQTAQQVRGRRNSSHRRGRNHQ